MNHFKHQIRDISKIKQIWTHCYDIYAPIHSASKLELEYSHPTLYLSTKSKQKISGKA